MPGESLAIMTELAFMVREDWAQRGSAMQQSSATIRAWLGSSRPVWVVQKPEKFDRERPADLETAAYISGSRSPGPVVGFDRLGEISNHDKAAHIAVVALHPYGDREGEKLRAAADDGRVGRIYVQVWSRNDLVRYWLEGVGALDLHTGQPAPAPDPVQARACEAMVGEEYNGLSTGTGKATVIHLLRAFHADGYALDTTAWLRAYFAAGGSFRHAQSVKKFIGEMRDGKQHQVQKRFKPEIVQILRDEVARQE